MYLEYDWTFGCFRPRFGNHFTGIRGVTSYNSLREAQDHLKSCGLQLGKKTDSRTWPIEVVPELCEQGDGRPTMEG